MVEWAWCWVGELFEFADLWVGTLPEGDAPGVGTEVFAEDFG